MIKTVKIQSTLQSTSKQTSRPIITNKKNKNKYYARLLIGLVLVLKSAIYGMDLVWMDTNACNHYQCQHIAHDVNRHLDPLRSKKPCDNFYNFACAKVILNETSSHRKSVPDKNLLLKKELEHPKRPKDIKMVVQMKHMFGLCVQEYSTISLDRFTKQQLNINQWPLLVDDNTRWEQLAGFAAQWQVATVFHMTLYKGMLTLYARLHRQMNLTMFDKLAPAIKLEVHKVKQFEVSLKKLRTGDKQVISVSKFLKDHPSIKLDVYFAKLFDKPDWRPTPEMKLYMDYGYFKGIADLIDKGTVSMLTIKNYISVRLMHAQKANPEDCASLFWKHLLAPSNIVYARRYGNRRNRQQFRYFLESLKDQILKQTRESTSIPAQAKQWALDRLTEVRFVVGWPEEVDDDSFVNKLPGLSGCNLDGEDAVPFMNRLHCYRKQVTIATLTCDPHYLRLMSLKNIAEYNAFFDPSVSTIFINLPVFEPPYFSADYPPVLNYAGGGFVVAHEIGHSIDNQRIREEHFPQADRDYFDAKLTCFFKRYNNYSLQYRHDKQFVDPRRTINENICDHVGLRVSYGAFRDSLFLHLGDKQGNAKPIPGLNYTLNQLFFLRRAQLDCVSVFKFKPTDAHSPDFVRIIGTFGSSQEFGDFYECLRGSPMRPGQVCQLWN